MTVIKNIPCRTGPLTILTDSLFISQTSNPVSIGHIDERYPFKSVPIQSYITLPPGYIRLRSSRSSQRMNLGRTLVWFSEVEKYYKYYHFFPPILFLAHSLPLHHFYLSFNIRSATMTDDEPRTTNDDQRRTLDAE